MSADDIEPGEDKALYRRGLGFLKQARNLRGLPDAAFVRIERRLERPERARRGRPWVLATATVVVVLLAGAALAVAHVGWRGLPFVGRFFGERMAPSRIQAPARTPKSAAPKLGIAVVPVTRPDEKPVAPEVPPAAGVAAATDEAAAAPPRKATTPAPRKLAVRTAEPAPAAAAPEVAPMAENPILAESRSFAAALERWHRDHDGRAALATLDAHDRQFPAGHLMPESRLLRAEILLAEGRELQGLALLDRLTLSGSPRARELFTVRGELRIKQGRCREGKADLDEVLAKGVADVFARRAVEALHHCP